MRFLLSLAIFVLLIFTAKPSHAQDVYNFNFQKSQGTQPTLNPTTTPMQNAAQAVNGVTPAPPDVNATEAEIKTKELKKKFKKWEFGAYKTWVGSTFQNQNSEPYTSAGNPTMEAISLTGAHRFNKFVALDGSLIMSTNWQGDYYSYLGSGKDLNGALGISIIPIHINFFGYELLEIGFNAGIMSMRDYVVDDSNSNEGEKDPEVVSNKKVYKPYLGPRISLNVTRDLGVILDGKLQPKTDGGGYASVGLRYRF